MVGPVLYQEMLLGSRRSRWHWFRWIYAIWLTLALGVWGMIYLASTLEQNTRSPNYHFAAGMSQYFVEFLAIQHFILLTMITPVLTAGAITDEKWRGTLQYLLTADLYPGEIVLGKLTGRIYQGIVLALVVLPILCFIGCFAGLGPIHIASFVLTSLALLFGLGSMSLLASVWCRHTRDAVLSVYCIGVIVFFGIPWGLSLLPYPTLSAWGDYFLTYLNPFNPLGSNWAAMTPEVLLQRQLGIIFVWGTFGLICLLLAVLFLRGSYIRQLEQGGKERKRHWYTFNRPPVGNGPLTWKERYVEGVAPLAVLRQIPTWMGVLVVFGLTVLSYGWMLLSYLPMNVTPGKIWQMVQNLDWAGLLAVAQRIDLPSEPVYRQGWIVLLLTGLVIGIRCSGAVTGERERQTWEALLLTPLETRQLIRGKLWGIAGASLPYLLAYGIPALLLSLIGGLACFYWTLLWLGVTVLGIFYVGAAGIWCSVRSASSWRSLVMTLAFTYLGGFLLFVATSLLALLVAVFLSLMLLLIDYLMQRYLGMQTPFANFGTAWINSFSTAICIALAGLFLLLSWLLLRGAEYRVGMLERIKHWKDEPRYYSRRRPRRRRRRRVREED